MCVREAFTVLSYIYFKLRHLQLLHKRCGHISTHRHTHGSNSSDSNNSSGAAVRVFVAADKSDYREGKLDSDVQALNQGEHRVSVCLCLCVSVCVRGGEQLAPPPPQRALLFLPPLPLRTDHDSSHISLRLIEEERR